MANENVQAPVVGNDVTELVSNVVGDTVETRQDRSSTNCVTPGVNRFDNKSVVFRCKEQTSDEMSMATQLGFDKHKSKQLATDKNGLNSPFSADVLSARFHLSHTKTNNTIMQFFGFSCRYHQC